ncbi:rubredoxin [Rhodomicrobium udaipurense JA643]|uniref:[NiFe]-hydrogenase assembly chaperone HybE n=1 Tax=Rhodomicrobium udaipurense TaxID=1202716 RepID=A0A8I1GEG9_9HYPH|nr:[NiFe]-hydrogenase assembly chaperone HybE [Rhodomicrobium udaipurense]KAI95453.1 rubredoxin [Rhodomicrobium udaipurense JA643]MBJ7543469.1 [NiFe]-hydrogenase assembly chaperone HybE [Rhodomicrobium udaipurense]
MSEAQADEAAAVARRLEAVFERIHATRMADVPLLNPRLVVAAVGPRDVGRLWLAVLVTPWFINAMLLPKTAEDVESWGEAPSGAKISHALPAGMFEFIAGGEAGLGPYRMCSLFSPVTQFEDQTAALIAAESALAALLDSGHHPDAEAARRKPQLSRRGLIFGRAPESGDSSSGDPA